ncbi:MAG TPA: DUF2726 domain-containing protein [Caldimonas sp.]
MDAYLIFGLAIAAAALLYWWSRKRRPAPNDTMMAEGDRLDTLIGWPPEAARVLRTSERLAYSTLKLALPGYMILAQVPIARFMNVPKRNSYAEWMRRLGSQCVDFVVCDVTSQVVAVIDVRPPDAQLSDRLRRRLDRVTRSLKAVNIPLHVWNEESLPSVEAARASIVPEMPAVPVAMASRKSAPVAAAVLVEARNPFEDTDRDSSHDEVIEVIELAEPSPSTWFDDLDSESSTLPPPRRRETG